MFENCFTERCMALVDEQGRVLTGDALKAAEQNPRAKRCGHRVKRAAKFCSKCGSPVPKGWWRCSGCGNMIGNESEFCPHCSKKQDLSARSEMHDGLWQKPDNLFAQRFDASDLEAIMKRGLTVQQGQRAILLEDEVFAGVLQPGRQSSEEMVGYQTFLKAGGRKQFVMVDAQDVAFTVTADVLTYEGLPVTLNALVGIAFDEKHGADFVARTMGADTALTYGDITRPLMKEVKGAVTDFCAQYAVDALYRDPRLRIALEDCVCEALTRVLDGNGLRFVYLHDVEFSGKTFERLRSMAGDVEIKRRELEFQLRTEALANDAALNRVTRDTDFEEQIADLAQRKKISTEMRDAALAEVKEANHLARVKAQQTLEMAELDHTEALKLKETTATIERRRIEHAEMLRQRLAEQDASLSEARVQVEIEKLQAELSMDKTRGWMAIKQAKEQVEQEREFARIKAYSGVDATTLVAAIDDPTRADRILQMKALEKQDSSSQPPMI